MPVLGLTELIFLSIFFILMVVGTAFDRRHKESPKWWILFIAAAVAIVYFWVQVDFSSMWSAVQSWSFWSFWKPFAIYLVAGLVYSVLEFILSVRKMARSHADSWNRFISTKVKRFKHPKTGDYVDNQLVKERSGKYFIRTSPPGVNSCDDEVEEEEEVTLEVLDYRESFKAAQTVGATSEQKRVAEELFSSYMKNDEYRMSGLKKDFVQVELAPETFEVQPVINRVRLSAFIGAWTFLWPAYAVSLILGDFLVEVFRIIGGFFSRLGGRFVRLTFADVFEV